MRYQQEKACLEWLRRSVEVSTVRKKAPFDSPKSCCLRLKYCLLVRFQLCRALERVRNLPPRRSCRSIALLRFLLHRRACRRSPVYLPRRMRVQRVL